MSPTISLEQWLIYIFVAAVAISLFCLAGLFLIRRLDRRTATLNAPPNRPSLAPAMRDRSNLSRIKLAPSYGYHPLATLDHDEIDDQPSESSRSPSLFNDGLDAWRDNYGELVPAELGLSEDLCRELETWNTDYEMFFNEMDPSVPRCTPDYEADHTAKGYDLARRVQSERPDLDVYVKEYSDFVKIRSLESGRKE